VSFPGQSFVVRDGLREVHPFGRGARAAIFCVLAAGSLEAQESRWSVDFGIERSDVTIDDDRDTWGTERVQLSYRDPARGGVFVGFERQTRFDQADAVILAGGYRRLGEWTVFGQVGVTPRADFYFRQSVEGEISRRTIGTLVAHLKYRYLNFPTAKVQVLSPAATYYFAKGELHGRAFFVRNEELDVDSQSFLARGQYQLNDRFRLSGGVAFGERIFDITFLPEEPAEGWVVYGETLVRVHETGAIGISLGFAHEEPFFDRRSFSLYYRRWF